MIFTVMRTATALLWLVILFNLIRPFPDMINTLLNLTAVVLLVAHFAEYVIFCKQIQRQPDSTSMTFLKTMIFGLFYWKDTRSIKS